MDSPSNQAMAYVLKTLSALVPRQHSGSEKWTYLQSLVLADPDPLSADPFDVIIGADLYGSLLLDGVLRGGMNEPVAQNTSLGRILSGRVLTKQDALSVTIHSMILESIDHQPQKFWELEDIPSHDPFTEEERFCETHFLSTHSRTASGRYIVRLPFKAGSQPLLGDSRSTAFRRWRQLEQGLQRSPLKSVAYTDFLTEYELLGHMERATPLSADRTDLSYFIPHHAVFREESLTSRIRVVFNASQVTADGTSLNDHLLQGPKLQTDLASIILRWRQYPYVFSSDIEKMFRQILVHPADTSYQRIFWRPKPSEEVQEFTLLTVTYGTKPAPFLALRSLEQLCVDEGHQFPDAVPVVRNQKYVDKFFFGANDKIAAAALKDQVVQLLAKGGFLLRKWASNDQSLLQDINPDNHGLALKNFDETDSLKILGITWNPKLDSFQFRIATSVSTIVTKRSILSTTARIFDPLGLLAPVTVVAKIILQKLWLLRCDWDEKVPDDVETSWTRFRTQLSALDNFTLSRWTFSTSEQQKKLHGFCDASMQAYAAVIYLRTFTADQRIVTSILIAKSKVAPIKTQSIPRLELCAAYLLSRLFTFVRDSLALSQVSCYAWTDSSITLEWIRQPASRWKTFIANRVAKIQEKSVDVTWGHVPTTENPADLASRGVYPIDLENHPIWWLGPSWLRKDSSEWPRFSNLGPLSGDLEERTNVVAHECFVPPLLDLQFKFSSWSKLLRVTAYCRRFIKRIRRQPVPETKANILHPLEIQAAKTFWLRNMQHELFYKEYLALKKGKSVHRTSQIAKLLPYLDAEDLIRVRGRLHYSQLPHNEKHPIILKDHNLLRQLIVATHKQLLHGGPSLVLGYLRQNFWIFRTRQLVRATLYRCLACARHRANPANQLMGDLPEYRITPVSKAFHHTGIDYAGPILTRSAPGRGRASHKSYIALFVCMTIKAVHIELVSNCSTAAFIAAYHRFVSRRGRPFAIYSDNATTCHGAERELTASVRAVNRDPQFRNLLAAEGVEWNFIPPAAPHFGGLWEAAVKSIKYHLRRCIGSLILTFEELNTALARIEACLNSRPLMPMSDNLDDFAYLTPGHFLIGAPLVNSPEPSVLDLRENRRSRWQTVQSVAEHFWNSWRKNYLHELQPRPRKYLLKQLVQPGQLVLLKENHSPPGQWLLARIIACHPGADGLVRVVTVRTSTTELKRPITKLCFLPVNIYETENPRRTAGGT